MFRYFAGILLIQIATTVLVLAALRTEDPVSWGVFAGIALVLSLVASVWFGSIADHIKKDALSKAQNSHAKEREKIQIRAEREKRKILEKSHERVQRAARGARSGLNLRSKAAVAGLAVTGGLLLFTQLFSLGLITLSVVGGAAAGYALRARKQPKSLPNAKDQPTLVLDTREPLPRPKNTLVERKANR